jgi:chromosome segregation ATPase
MNAMQRTMIHKIAGLAVDLADEHRAHLDRQHAKREALREAELERIKAANRFDEVKQGALNIPRDRRQQHFDEAREELQDAENRVADAKEAIARLEARMHEIAAQRDRARKLSEALMRAAKTTHPDFAKIEAGSLSLGTSGAAANAGARA